MSFEQGALDIGSVGCTTVYHDWTPKESPLCRTHAVLSTYFTQDLNFSQSAGSNKQLVWDPWSLVWHRIPFSVPFGSCLVQSQPMAFGIDGQCLAGSFQVGQKETDGRRMLGWRQRSPIDPWDEKEGRGCTCFFNGWSSGWLNSFRIADRKRSEFPRSAHLRQHTL